MKILFKFNFLLTLLLSICAFTPQIKSKEIQPLTYNKTTAKDSLINPKIANLSDSEFLVEIQTPTTLSKVVGKETKELDLMKAKYALAMDSIEALNFELRTLKFQLKKCKERK